MKSPQYVPVVVETDDGKKAVGVAKATYVPESGHFVVDMRIINVGIVEKMRADLPPGAFSLAATP